MAAGNAIRYHQEETTCAVCLDFFQDPVMILSCARGFCLWRCAPCPQCRCRSDPHGAFRPDPQPPMAMAMAAAQELRHTHQPPLTPFCHRHGVPPVCIACIEHRADPAVPPAATGSINPLSLRKQFEASLKTFQEENKRRAGLTEAAKETRQEMLTRVNTEKQKLRAMLEGLRRVLSDQESQFLSQLHRLCWRNSSVVKLPR